MHFVAASSVPGDYLEFGVFQGASFTRAFKINQYLFAAKGRLKEMHFYAFDSFEGLPPVRNAVDLEVEQFRGGQYACGKDAFTSNLVCAGVDLSRVHLVEGFYDTSLNDAMKKNIPLRAAAIIHVDVDLYESTRQLLDFVTDYVQDGTVIVFDDWFCFKGHPERGEQKAFREWLGRNPSISATEWYRVGWQANSFILHRS